ncbi:hypothetical protein HMPREF1991_02267 [Hoylesella loescheii DSM 19665 = JCM 12249 = ATCC 15930]|uniref:Uncharacterized protein n=1 Tax=Hoylesella loescheii DSM 19665 = JCM 12249 = ATCC 15930 TaxID=1122985 RepID=A0A069QG92_HOYLO|nr:hypothetical protein HMPREF1991_02267 [Hoylesella loescheii DSM 19665 = JCM 12249 = ATCC 15930]
MERRDIGYIHSAKIRKRNYHTSICMVFNDSILQNGVSLAKMRNKISFLMGYIS